MVSMKKLCSECKARFEVALDDAEEGDALNCPECNLEYTIIADKKGVLKLIESKTLEMEDEDEEEESDEADTEDCDSD
jgi:DNA-directed RNA polymerase subunit RPC12/RpoP